MGENRIWEKIEYGTHNKKKVESKKMGGRQIGKELEKRRDQFCIH